MEGVAKLITAVGTLLGAIAWPGVALVLGFFFKQEIRAAFARLPSFLDRMRKMKIAGIETDLDKIADASADAPAGQITPAQVETAAKISVEGADYVSELLAQLDRLSREYDTIRRIMTAGPVRTQAMTRVIAKMRALAPSLVANIDIYKSSGSPGSRLAAVAMMQMDSSASDLGWLSTRFMSDQPFIFYHAALAMQNLATSDLPNDEWENLLGAAERSLDVVSSFKGTPDRETAEVLEQLISDIKEKLHER